MFLPTQLQGKLQLPIKVGTLGTKVEEFCLELNLMPSGFLINVSEHAVQLWNFDDIRSSLEQYQKDKKRLKSKLESQVTFSSREEISDCAFNDKQNLLVIFHKNFTVSAIQLGKLEKKYQALLDTP